MGTLKILTCTHPNLVQHQKLTLYANFHALCRKSRQISLTAWTTSTATACGGPPAAARQMNSDDEPLLLQPNATRFRPLLASLSCPR